MDPLPTFESSADIAAYIAKNHSAEIQDLSNMAPSSLTSARHESTEQPTTSTPAAQEPKDPAAVEPELEVKSKDGRRKLSWEEAIGKVPEDVADVFKGMRADYTKKTQQLAAERKALAAERAAIEQMKAEASKAPLPEWDPWDTESVSAHIEAAVQARLDAVLRPMQEQSVAAAQTQAYNEFLSANPEFKTDKELRAQVREMLEANDHMDLETAYYVVVGKRAKAGKGTVRPTAEAAARKAQQQAALVGTGAARRTPEVERDLRKVDAKKMSNAEILELARRHAR